MDGITGREDQKRDEEKIPDEVYREAARAQLAHDRSIAVEREPEWAELVAFRDATDPSFRAAIAVAYRAGREDVARKVQDLVRAAWEMCVEQQHHNAPGWSMAKSWAWEKLSEAVEPFLDRDEEGTLGLSEDRQPGVQPTEEQRAREEDQERDEEQNDG